MWERGGGWACPGVLGLWCVCMCSVDLDWVEWHVEWHAGEWVSLGGRCGAVVCMCVLVWYGMGVHGCDLGAGNLAAAALENRVLS
jgi:hypothetical protein